MKEYNHTKIDLLKLDIEGAENKVSFEYLDSKGYDNYRFPSSFSTICTKQCKQELIGFLLSLSLHHPNANTYVICDEDTKNYIEESTPQPKLNIIWNISLDKYSKYDRNQMVILGIWSEFQMAKATVIEFALTVEKDTLYLDSDTIILDKMYIDDSKELGVSPQFIKKENIDETGYYNGGMLWTNQKTLPNKWREYTKKSRYYDQASIEDLVKEYEYFEFGDNYNLQTWRFIVGEETSQTIASYLNVQGEDILYKTKPLKFIHTHFNDVRFKNINDFFILLLSNAKRYKELSIIYRVING